MATIASKIGDLIPEGNTKNTIRMAAFKVLFTTAGNRKVKLGTKNDKIDAQIGRLVLSQESLGEREIEGYLQHYQVKEGDIIVNAGAYHGYFALYLSKKVGKSGQIICFEPEQNNLKLLHHNIQLNNANNITVIPKGLWHSDGQLPIVSKGSGSTIEPNSGWKLQSTPVVALDNELKRLGINNVDLLTMDIEGAEIEAVKGCKETIASNPNVSIAIASYHKVNGERASYQVEKTLQSYGLNVKTEFPRHLTTYAQRASF